MSKPKWVIMVGGYGAFLYEGTETEAEDMRRHKANWERGIGVKRLATASEISTTDVSHCWNHPNFNTNTIYQCRCSDENCFVDAQRRRAR